MADMKWLCIGGPLNGQFRETAHSQEESFIVPVFPEQTVAGYRACSPQDIDTFISYERVVYYRRRWHVGPEQPMAFVWVIEGLTDADVWHLLTQAYAELHDLKHAMHTFRAPTPERWMKEIHG